ncbi:MULTISPECIES: Crp/Fnr family transcriptional regulator [unclassified Methylobacterium]|uniref:Crp/Fnr family transcriptional regulator n=1 Tax=unclassified Methylobacterium TaxID=2615210 RepID=UPI002269FF9D|nr:MULTISPECIES: Crp/Fnr family transcriptional regulator [unclassified Methylobacterium]
MQTSPAGTNPLLAKLSTYADLDVEDRMLLREVCADVRYVTANTDLISQGDAPEGVFLVLEGFACRYKLRQTGVRQIMAYLVPGDLGDLDVTLLDRMDHAIGTLSACTVARLAPETVQALLRRPKLAAALRKSALVDEATAREWLVNVGRRSAPERIAHLFCELLGRLRVIGYTDGNSYMLPLTQVDLADTTGLTSVHINRSLQDMRKAGLIELRRRRLTILDLPGLVQLAEFDPSYLHLASGA